MDLPSLGEAGLGNTPLHRACLYEPSGRLYLKLESANPTGSVKARTAWFLLRDLLDSGRLREGTALVESTSGNLGLAVGLFARVLGVRFVALVDSTMPVSKRERLEEHGIETRLVELGDSPDHRTARLRLAAEMGSLPGWEWPNQFENAAGVRAHWLTTGPEIWEQTRGRLGWVVAPVGTGGTVCGVGGYLKSRRRSVQVVGVEPRGSAIFGGPPGCFLNVGAGLPYPSRLVRDYGGVIDFACKVDDGRAVRECIALEAAEHLTVGVTSGAALVAAREVLRRDPREDVVVVCPDAGTSYHEILRAPPGLSGPPPTLARRAWVAPGPAVLV